MPARVQRERIGLSDGSPALASRSRPSGGGGHRHAPKPTSKTARYANTSASTVRPSACVATLAEVHHADRYPTQWPAEPTAWLSPRGLAAAWVAAGVDNVVGHIGVVVDADDAVPAAAKDRPLQQLASVSRLFVAPPAREAGLGRDLLAAATDFARSEHLDLVLDVVDDANGAIALYERRGWRLIDRRPAAWTTDRGVRPILRRYAAPEP